MKIYNVVKIPQGLGYDQFDYEEVWQSGYTAGYESGYTDGQNDCPEPEPVYSAMGLTLEVLSAGTIVFGKTHNNAPTDAFLPYLNGVNIGEYEPRLVTSGWITFTTDKKVVDVVPGDVFVLIGRHQTFQPLGNTLGYHTFSGSTAVFKAYGNLVSVCVEHFINIDTFAELAEQGMRSADWALTGLFNGCTGLTDATNLVLPKDTTNFCYASMFEGCTSLTAAPSILPASALSQSCYDTMFRCCSSLTTAPVLPATTLAENCYSTMFSGCTSLATAPALPATTLTASCYSTMFAGCTSLTTAPALPATTLGSYCYRTMFAGCTGLTTAPELPATSLQEGCYEQMFYGCTSLTTAPVLPAVNPKHLCYANMFQGCTSLNYVKCLFVYEDIMMNPTGGWLSNVSPTGTFVKDARMQEFETGPDGIPNNWTIEEV